MFFTFPENARWDAEVQAVEFGSKSAVPRSGPGTSASIPTPATGPADDGAMRRGLLLAADALREHRRAEASTAPADRRW